MSLIDKVGSVLANALTVDDSAVILTTDIVNVTVAVKDLTNCKGDILHAGLVTFELEDCNELSGNIPIQVSVSCRSVMSLVFQKFLFR